jgi:hypothetical protein
VSGVIVEVSARKFSVPFECACCGGGEPEGEITASHTRRTGVRVIRETTRGLNFPYCHRCLAHAKLWQSAEGVKTGILIIGAVGGIVIGLATGGVPGFIAFLISIPLALIFAARRRREAIASCNPMCATPDVAVCHLGWSGSIVTFSFAAPPYAAKFALGNSKNLINVSPELRRLLQQPPPNPPRAIAPPPSDAAARMPARVPVRPKSSQDPVLEWIARIEGYKGPVARRNALERALTEIEDPKGRAQLVLAASRIEVAAVLDKVDSLTSTAAKKRHLQKAITDIRSDNIPDELQAEELRQLEERLRSLG